MAAAVVVWVGAVAGVRLSPLFLNATLQHGVNVAVHQAGKHPTKAAHAEHAFGSLRYADKLV